MSKNLLLGSKIPWDKIKSKDFEEVLYWLFVELGAKDIRWRIGGSKDGASDGGRDIELTFYSEGPDGLPKKESWWIEAKSRKNKLEKSSVQNTILNTTNQNNLDVLVIATSGYFTNPTRDWVTDYQKNIHIRESNCRKNRS
ncbi:MAG: restriction endonuclease [Caldisericia bacterium]